MPVYETGTALVYADLLEDTVADLGQATLIRGSGRRGHLTLRDGLYAAAVGRGVVVRRLKGPVSLLPYVVVLVYVLPGPSHVASFPSGVVQFLGRAYAEPRLVADGLVHGGRGV